MEWTRYKVALLLCAAVVIGGVSVSLAQFNYRVRPEVPLRAFKLENTGNGIYRVDFLGESANLALPEERAMRYGDTEKIKEYREQAEKIFKNLKHGFQIYLSGTMLKVNNQKEALKEDLIFYSSRWEELIP